MRLFTSVIATVAMFLTASVAGAAITYTAATSVDSGNSIDALVPGDVVTIDITLRSDGERAFAIGGSATGYDPAVAVFDSGTARTDVLVQVCIPAAGCFGGLANSVGPALSESLANPLGPEVQFLNAVSITGSVFTGATDEGVSGLAGSAQFQLVFVAGTPGTTTIDIGSNAAFGDALIIAGGAIGQTTNATVSLTVIPEPGTALLMGLGLAGLAAAGRRDS